MILLLDEGHDTMQTNMTNMIGLQGMHQQLHPLLS